MRSSPATLALALGCSTTFGCSTNDIDDLCDKACECMTCSDADRQECVDQSNGVRDDAVQQGCEEEIDDFIDCVVDESICDGDDLKAGSQDGCVQEREAMQSCVCVDVGGSPSKLRYCLVD